MTIRYELNNLINFISPDIQEDDPANTFPHIFGNEEFSFEVSFFANTEIGSGSFINQPINNISIESFPSYVIVEKIGPGSVRITKDANTSIFEEGYSFSSIDANTLSQSTESIDISELPEYIIDDQLMISWDTPPDETANTNAIEFGQYVFTLSDGVNSNNIVSYTQSYFWSPFDGYDNFQILLEDL